MFHWNHVKVEAAFYTVSTVLLAISLWRLGPIATAALGVWFGTVTRWFFREVAQAEEYLRITGRAKSSLGAFPRSWRLALANYGFYSPAIIYAIPTALVVAAAQLWST
ncbi:MAG: hypothetical protein MI755_16225 [Sphingomonadales bacterium]|nr:hypothetical protein [Sphingomonadales bacterium]